LGEQAERVSDVMAENGASRRRVLACAGAIRDHDARLRAFITPMIEGALERADELDAVAERGDEAGPLHGLVVAVKDNIDVAGLRCTAGSAFFADHVPNRYASVIERLRRAGAVLIGKTNLHEFAYGGTTQNEHHGAAATPGTRRACRAARAAARRSPRPPACARSRWAPIPAARSACRPR
jgi:aspartyl-tRNA(Asn)/glutamyl-tRNA(Gln) amidotransferase subunit A